MSPLLLVSLLPFADFSAGGEPAADYGPTPAGRARFLRDLGVMKTGVAFTPLDPVVMIYSDGFALYRASVAQAGAGETIERLLAAVGDPDTLVQVHKLLVQHPLREARPPAYTLSRTTGNYYGLRYDADPRRPGHIHIPDAAAQAADLQRRWRAWLAEPGAPSTDFFDAVEAGQRTHAGEYPSDWTGPRRPLTVSELYSPERRKPGVPHRDGGGREGTDERR